MKKFCSFLLLFALLGCDDGDFSVESLNFDDVPVQNPCGNLLIFKIGGGGTEALMIELDGQSQDIFSSIPADGSARSFPVNNNSNRIIYRIFNDNVSALYFCRDIPPTTPVVNEEWFATGGTVQISTSLEEDDNDNLPAELEGIVRAADGSIDAAASQNSDGDALPDYIDFDDDGDNVLTSEEIEIVDGEIVYTDTDGDGIPNYLDPDDDGDGIPTIQEDLNGDNNPANDIQQGNTEPNYLIPSLTTANTNVSRRSHRYTEIYLSTITIINGFQLENGENEIKYDIPSFDFGTVTREVTQSGI
ncbi:hypothetical protein [Robertkochia aurantiaca]|uniref:hypothetical protein n=1 Tax=Robertkochia aurantiaca TaxID=2873700 RepID=UPI001CCC7755|nr:hypothetical protein [Robertkochia sp. 3YJGBD-33]